jgi:predicted AlkP superfamily pyrophosphatase or phosphodiesterase
MSRPVVVIDIVGLTPALLAHMPRVAAVGRDGFQAELIPILPAVTCSVQSTMLTGTSPREHGIVGNGWLFRELCEIWLWRQSNRLVAGEKVWDAARRRLGRPIKCANMFWWYAMGSTADIAVTPRPVYHVDGCKAPGIYAYPAPIGADLVAHLGAFPLFDYWGPRAGSRSSAWIAAAAGRVFDREHPDLTLVYLPHLDYDLQRYGGHGPHAEAAAADIDAIAGALIDHVRAAGATVLIVSEYGITNVHRPVHINRRLREAGLLDIACNDAGGLLDTFASQAFAVADHQIAHLYAAQPAALNAAQEALQDLPGIAEILDDDTKRAAGIDHPRAGDLVLVADADAWFTYYYWLDSSEAPDFALTVDIHRKPGYDPAELFFADNKAKAKAALRLTQKALGFRYAMDVIPAAGDRVRGSHGRMPDSACDAPVLLCTDAALGADRLAAADVFTVILDALR